MKSISIKLQVILLTIISLSVLAIISTYSKGALMEQSYDKLSTLKDLKKHIIEVSSENERSVEDIAASDHLNAMTDEQHAKLEIFRT